MHQGVAASAGLLGALIGLLAPGVRLDLPGKVPHLLHLGGEHCELLFQHILEVLVVVGPAVRKHPGHVHHPPPDVQGAALCDAVCAELLLGAERLLQGQHYPGVGADNRQHQLRCPLACDELRQQRNAYAGDDLRDVDVHVVHPVLLCPLGPCDQRPFHVSAHGDALLRKLLRDLSDVIQCRLAIDGLRSIARAAIALPHSPLARLPDHFVLVMESVWFPSFLIVSGLQDGMHRGDEAPNCQGNVDHSRNTPRDRGFADPVPHVVVSPVALEELPGHDGLKPEEGEVGDDNPRLPLPASVVEPLPDGSQELELPVAAPVLRLPVVEADLLG
mmetsp:Transcript_22263/g.61762  ORF Transcript_22263/g.61762 Transcript_22263/m.61762 type:complete len:331 (-) Transcript_22263:854-1846(-)